MENNFLPLGSVVILKGSVKKQVIVTRAILNEVDGKKFYYEYAGCDYPEGVQTDKLNYFNNESIYKIVYKGYEDEHSKEIIKKVCEYLEINDIKKASVEPENI